MRERGSKRERDSERLVADEGRGIFDADLKYTKYNIRKYNIRKYNIRVEYNIRI